MEATLLRVSENVLGNDEARTAALVLQIQGPAIYQENFILRYTSWPAYRQGH